MTAITRNEDPIIQVRNISKQYNIGMDRTYKTFSESFINAIRSPIKSLQSIGYQHDTFWALKDINFDVNRGEVVGIIGRNGAGKSTLLKILSRITTPTEGEISLKGRVGSLLEVGTGFHPELTGRENIYFNGAILGMKKKEIGDKFDEIVKFSGVEKFLDTPVKRYSSGMQVRLAFSVAANLDPEILIVDEVLAVGDAAFQKKCLGKMGEVAESGRTVLFVSHNMKAIMNLCNRVIWLKNGKFNKSGDTRSITEDYLQDSLCAIENDDISEIIAKLPEDPSLKINHVAIVQNGKTKNHILSDRAFSIEIDYSILQNAKGIRIYFDLLDNDGTILIRSFNDEQAIHVPVIEPGNYFSKAIIPGNLLAPTNYELRIRGTIYNERSCTGDGIGIQIVVEDTSNLNRAYPNEPVRSKLRPIISWDNKKY